MIYGLKKSISIHKAPKKSLLYFTDNIKGNYYINMTGTKILELCDGLKSVDDIANILSNEYNDDYSNVKNLVKDFLKTLTKMQIVEELDIIQKRENNISGNFEVFAPITLSIEITKQCPLKCVHCYTEGEQSNFTHLDFNDIVQILDNAKKIGIPNIFFTGGEVFIHPRFYEILEYAYKKFNTITLATSGYYIDENTINLLKDFSRVIYRVSLDGNEYIHNKIRRNKSAFKKAINAISLLNRSNLFVTATMTISNLNKCYIEEAIKIAKKYGANRFEYGFVLELGRASEDMVISVEDLKLISLQISKFKEMYDNTEFKIVERQGELLEVLHKEQQINCGAGHTQLAILANGDYTPCLSLPFTLSNIKNHNIEQLLRLNIINFYRTQKSPNSEICSKCDNLPFCDGCHARALTMDKNCMWKILYKDGLSKHVG